MTTHTDLPTDDDQPGGISRRKALTSIGAAGAAAWVAPALLTIDGAAAAGSDPDLVDSYVLSTPIGGARWLGGFERANPTVYRTNKQITGLVAGDDLRGIDFRPATGDLYGIARRTTTGELVVYVIVNPSSAPTAALIGVAVGTSLGATERIGFDFNPSVDRLRVVTTSGKNYRLHPVSGALVMTDGPLAYAAGDVNEGESPAVSGAAYTNNFARPAGMHPGTVLYDIDASAEALVRQNANVGTLTTVGPVDLPSPAVQTLSGFDIVSTGGTDAAYAVYRLGGANMIYSVTLATGGHSALGALGSGGLAGGPVFSNLEGLAIRA